MTRRSDNRSLYARHAVLACAASMVLALTADGAFAQTSSYQPATDSVVINWGAIDGGSAAPRQRSGAMPRNAPAGNGQLLMPGLRMPRSQLYVSVPGGTSSTVTLRKPGSAAQARSKPKPAPKQSVEPAKAPEAPKQLAEKPAAEPKPEQMPKAPEPQAKAAPPPATESASAPPPPPATESETASAPPPPPAPAAPESEAKKESEKPKETEQASAPPAATSGAAKVLFNDSDTKLTADGQAVLDGVLGDLEKSKDLRVQLMAYAAGEELTSSKARRISLSRALSVRSYLIEKGLRSTRIDVRALGDKAEDDPKNRVDVNIVKR